jgi:hypothetical protein
VTSSDLCESRPSLFVGHRLDRRWLDLEDPQGGRWIASEHGTVTRTRARAPRRGRFSVLAANDRAKTVCSVFPRLSPQRTQCLAVSVLARLCSCVNAVCTENTADSPGSKRRRLRINAARRFQSFVLFPSPTDSCLSATSPPPSLTLLSLAPHSLICASVSQLSLQPASTRVRLRNAGKHWFRRIASCKWQSIQREKKHGQATKSCKGTSLFAPASVFEPR